MFCGSHGLLLALDDDDGGDQRGGRGKGGDNGGSGGGDGDGDEACGGDDGSRDGRDPLLLAGVASGLGSALDGLQEALRNLRMPWARKVNQRPIFLHEKVPSRG